MEKAALEDYDETLALLMQVGRRTERVISTASVSSASVSSVLSAQDSSENSRDVSRSPEDMKYSASSETSDGSQAQMSSSPANRQKHSLIEKRRRKKMNGLIAELSAMLPNPSSASKLDKISVLRCAVQHIKSIQGSTNMYWNCNKPPLVSDSDMKALVEQESTEMLFVITCDEGKFLHVSRGLADALGIQEFEWVGSSVFEKLYSKDVAVVKEQMSYASQIITQNGGAARQEGISSGAWRSFLCHLKTNNSTQQSFGETGGSNLSRFDTQGTLGDNVNKRGSEQKYLPLHCVGFVKACDGIKVDSGDESESEVKKCNCLIMAANVLKPPVESEFPEKPWEYHMRLDMDGRITHVEIDVARYTGHSPHELIGTSVYELYHEDDIASMEAVIRTVHDSRTHVVTPEHRVRTKNGGYVVQYCDLYNFVNPWTNSSDHIMCKSIIKTSRSDTHGDWSSENSVPTTSMSNVSTVNQQASNVSTPGVHGTAATVPPTQILPLPRGVTTGGLPLSRIPQAMVTPSLYNIRPSQNPHRTPVYSSTMLLTPESSPISRPNMGCESAELTRSADEHVGTRPADPPLQQDAPSDSPTADECFGSPETAMSIALSFFENNIGTGGPIDFGDFQWNL